jgi:hypothetical protein
MAISNNNPLVDGASGKFGNNLVFRQRGKTTILSARPRPSTQAPTDKQMNQRFLFTEASAYAKSANADPLVKAAYFEKAKGNQTAYNVAFKDFLTAPVLHKVETSTYSGAVGDKITCRITDVMAVTEVKLSLYDASGTLIEEGLAVQSSLKLDWVYTATVAHTPILGTRILVQMTDTPANVYTEEFAIS